MNNEIYEKLINFKMTFFREKYRFDQGNAFLVFLNFTMLVMSLVKQAHGSTNTIYWYVLAGFAGTWLLGYFLDKVVRVQDASEKVALKRSPIWKENFKNHDCQDKKINQINKRLDNIEKMIKDIS